MLFSVLVIVTFLIRDAMALTKRQEVEPQVVELKMLRILMGVTRRHRIRTEYTRETAQAERDWRRS